MSLSISFSCAISLDTACETLITVARSVFDRRPDRARRAGRGLFRPKVGIHLVELPHLAVGSPTQIAVAGIPKIHTRKLFEPTRRVEARGELVCERLVVDEAVGACRADGLFVEVLSIELAPLQARDLGADQRGAVLEVLRTVLRPDLQLPVMRGQSV